MSRAPICASLYAQLACTLWIQNVRELSGIDEMARTLTSWAAFGAKQLPPHYWLEFVDIEEQRSVDMLDVLHASAARDVESHDSCFSSHFWNISQNLGKEKHRGAVSGVAGCITPGGRVFLPHIGRPLLGCEKLLLQGIPYFRLLLGNETEVQVGGFHVALPDYLIHLSRSCLSNCTTTAR